MMFIEITENGYSGLRRSDRNALRRETWNGVGTEWHERYRNKHFTPAGFAEYGYTPRSKRYNARKKKVLGHTRPLEFTGESKERSKTFRVVATKNGARVVMNQVRAFNFRPLGGRIDMRKEFTTVSRNEVLTLQEFANADLERRYRRAHRTQRTRIR